MKPEPTIERDRERSQIHGHDLNHVPNDEVLHKIASAIRGVRYGAVEIVIQDSRVVQIERKEKFRFDKPARF